MISAPDAMTAWREALLSIKESGRLFIDDEGRACKEVVNLAIEVTGTADVRAPLSFIRTGEWIYPSDEELEDALFSRTNEEGRYGYGARIFSFRGELDQLEGFVIPLLRAQPETRRAMIILADPIADEVALSRHFVSLTTLWFRIIERRLVVTAVVRSNDVLIGWPANISQVSLMQRHVAERLGIAPGAIMTFSFSAHYFVEDEELIEKLARRKQGRPA